MAQVALTEPTDDFSDLQHLDLDEPFYLTESEPDLEGHRMSRASSYYGDDEEMDKCILECDLESIATQISTESVSNLDNTTSFELGKCKPTLVNDASLKLGKRKVDQVLIPDGSPESQRVFKQPRIQDPPGKDVTSKATVVHIDPSKSIINSPPHVVAQSFAKLPYGAQYEITRLVNNGRANYADFLSLISDLTSVPALSTNTTVAPLVSKILKTIKAVPDDAKDPFAALFEKESRVRNPWEELDKEDKAMANDPFGAMGFNKDGSPSEFYGGQVQFRGTLSLPRDAKEPTLKLEAPTLGPSTQFGRRFGSKSLFRIKLSKEALWMNSMALLNYFRRPFIICGFVFRSFYSKEDNVFLIKTDERWDGTNVLQADGESGVMSFMDFINWHNSLELNCNQAMAKWASRTALGLSNSAPGVLLPRDSIKFIPDIVNADTGADMTDGAGSMNRAVGRKLVYRYNWHQHPSAIQIRAYGAKGLLVEDIGDDSDDPVIYLAPSQIKIKYLASDDDPAHRAIDVLRASHLKTPCQLSSELVVNLAENGVPLQAFVDLLRASLDEAISPLLDWDPRERPGIARVQGWSERDAVEQNNDGEDGLKELDGAGANSEQRSLTWWADPISGLPSPLKETIIEALDSGFTPKNCPYLRAKLGNCIVGYVDRIVSSYHIDMPMSCTSMIVPDRSGVLAEGEVFVKASGRYLQLPDGTSANTAIACGQWKAVDKPEFHSLGMADVIVLSTKGSRRAADWLAGGDYDGDKVLVVWQPELVEPFRNADERYADPPSDMDSRFFQKEVERVSTFSEKTAGLPEIEKIHELQYHLLGALRNTSLVGRYSNYHDIAVYQKGYKHPETRRLAIMFCTVLDSVKSGLSVKPEVLMDDQRRYGALKAPLWTESMEKGNSKIQSPDNSNSGYPERGKGLKPFIMDGLFKRGKELRNEWKGKIERKTGPETSFVMDPDLVAPYQEFERMAAKEVARRNAADEVSGPGVTLSVAQSSSGGNPSEEWSYANDLILIRKHVEEIYKEHKEKIGQAPAGGGGRPSSSLPGSDLDSAALTGLPIQRRQDILRSLSRKFAMYPTADELHLSPGWAARVKASYAYFYDCGQQKNKRKWTQFPWNVAFRDLCDIKAQVDSGYKTVRRECFYDRMALKALIGRLKLN
ncbi:hypothetical protein EST38_g10750 [Candolleomyces aberdarensis]|uniref:RNA-dependent RNA polymerase n=1 Tax=Candolleomyces aberdarensis TaxID=2316362 RepID=A0A4Q2D9G4_9AGAR|nr:hypothetical protein EST38_g10750 [Candolleomyces aberdarensis]